MGQESSVPSKQGHDDPLAPTSGNIGANASPQAFSPTSPPAAEANPASSSSAAASSSHETASSTLSAPSSNAPQSRKKPPPMSSPTANGQSSAAASSLMSRAGLTSMIQRMGGPSASHNAASQKLKSRKTYHPRGGGGDEALGVDANHRGNGPSGNVGAVGSLVGKMTDLVLGEPPQPNDTQQQQPQQQPNQAQQQPNDEEDWEKAWAEDSESDEEEEATLESTLSVTLPPPASAGLPPSTAHSLRIDAISPTGHTVSSNFRPDLDAGHSSMGVGILEGEMREWKMDMQMQQIQQQQQQQQEMDSAMWNQEQYQNRVMAQQIEQEQRLAQEADDALREQWDGYHHDVLGETTAPDLERPCVEMFDPALRVLGRGSFGRVVLVQKRYGHGQGGLYAMKILRKSHLVRRRQIERTKTERRVLSVLNHPFIMRLYYAFQTAEKLYLVLDYCPGGELFFHLSRYRRFQEPVARFYAAELLLAIGHLHKHGIIYRDLKPENVLLDAYGHVKLGDFGLAKDGIRHPTQGAKSTCGTPEYMAPEVLNQTGHGFCVDYWGLGMILYEMMTGLPPWYTTDRSKLFRRLRSAPLVFPNEVQFSPHCKACIAGLLERDPRLRLGVLGLRSAMRHEFFYRRINFEALRACQISAPIRPCEGWRQFARRNSVMEGQDSSSSSVRGHSAGPSFESGAMGHITAELLDVATENFDDTFRRMPIETEDYEKMQQASGHAPITDKELNSQTFRGFTFDGDGFLEDEGQYQYDQLQQEQFYRQQQHEILQQQVLQQQQQQHQQAQQHKELYHQHHQQQQQEKVQPKPHFPHGNESDGRGEIT